jgi:glycosyltransferase involved in cell wall biosynthesis
MRIAVNGKSLGVLEKGGAVRIAQRLLAELTQSYPDHRFEIFVPVGWGEMTDLPQFPKTVEVHMLTCMLFRYSLFRALWEQCLLPLWIYLQGSFDLLINLTNTAPVLIPLPIPQVLLVHDVGFLNSRWFSQVFGLYLRWALNRAIRQNIHLVTVSQSSAADIQAAFPAVRSRRGSSRASPITVIKNGVDPPPPQIQSIDLDYDYILFIGSQNPRKNLAGAIASYILFQAQSKSDLHFVIIGAAKKIFTPDPTPFPSSGQIHIMDYVEESVKWSYLKGAKLLLLPSFMEGFGLPVAEALQMNIPAVVSDIPVFHELYGESVEYVNPHAPEDIARGILAVLHTSSGGQTGSNHYSSLENSSFPWKNTARQYLKLFQTICRE